jgi:hypothetical protein
MSEVSQVLFSQAANFDGMSVTAAAGLIVCAVRGSEAGQKLLSAFGIHASNDKVNTQDIKPQLATMSAGTRAELARMACNVA